MPKTTLEELFPEGQLVPRSYTYEGRKANLQKVMEITAGNILHYEEKAHRSRLRHNQARRQLRALEQQGRA
jgi:hypothetical protein